MNDNEQKLDIATKQLKKVMVSNKGGAQAELNYGLAYLALMREGKVCRLRRKYQVRRG